VLCQPLSLFQGLTMLVVERLLWTFIKGLNIVFFQHICPLEVQKKVTIHYPCFLSCINGPFNWCTSGPCLDKCMLCFLTKFQLQIFNCCFCNIS
jgi:hypothetical protein